MRVCIFLVVVYEALERHLLVVLLVGQMKYVLSFCLKLRVWYLVVLLTLGCLCWLLLLVLLLGE